jgi:hypothetical protein
MIEIADSALLADWRGCATVAVTEAAARRAASRAGGS